MRVFLRDGLWIVFDGRNPIAGFKDRQNAIRFANQSL